MARKPRLHYPGACYHVILRGNGGQDIFFDDEDREYFLQLLREGVERYGHRVHCYCLMANHIHLVIQVSDISLSRIMQNVSFRYTRYIHSKTKQIGHLFQGRYKALLVDTDNYLLQLIRYIHNNPVRIFLVDDPQKYTWSSHRRYLKGSFSKTNSWITTKFVLKMFAADAPLAVKLYHEFIQKGVNENYTKIFSNGASNSQIIGEDGFIQKAYEKSSLKHTQSVTMKSVIQKVCKAYQTSQKDLASGSRERLLAEARAMAALLVREIPQLTLTELGNELNRDLSGLSQAAQRLYRKLSKDTVIAGKFNLLYESLIKSISQA